MKKSNQYKTIAIFLTFLLISWAFPLSVSAEDACPAQNTNSKFIKMTRIKLNAINPTSETNPAGAYYPGFRGNNQLVIYTPAYGEYTNTNEFGKEAVVIDDKVVEFCGSNCYIPKNGFCPALAISKNGHNKPFYKTARCNFQRNHIFILAAKLKA